MRAALKLLLFGVISASVSIIALPIQAKMVQKPKIGCCERLTAPNHDGDCGSDPAKPSPDQQCCATCALGLTLFFGNFYAADLLANGKTNNFIKFSFSERPLRSAP